MWWSIVGLGGSCFVTSTDKKTALKGHQVWEDGELRALCQHNSEEVLAREAFVYKHLGEHPHILLCYGLEEVHPGVNSLRLEYAPLGDVRSFIKKHKAVPLEESIRLRMALGTALSLSYINKMGVQHCDISCRNPFIFNQRAAKVSDLNIGSLIKGYDELKPSVYEESAYELPLRGREFRNRPAQKMELFALGSAIYEMVVWASPYEGLEDDEIERKYAAREFSILEGISASSIIQMCWDEEYGSPDTVAEALKALITSQDELKTTDV
ncbi:kinase-like protein [Biscogniauxia marginata]|nr:kinase-like protein [Biscogniauxia marginata]